MTVLCHKADNYVCILSRSLHAAAIEVRCPTPSAPKRRELKPVVASMPKYLFSTTGHIALRQIIGRHRSPRTIASGLIKSWRPFQTSIQQQKNPLMF